MSTEHNINIPVVPPTVQRLTGEATAVNSASRLLNHVQEEGATEFYSDRLQAQLILLEQDGNIANRHQRLIDKGVPVFTGLVMQGAGINILLVPEGARTLESMATVLDKSERTNHAVFNELGRTLSVIERAGYGMPTDRVLGQFALAFNPSRIRGAEIFFIPPYFLDEQADCQTTLEVIAGELERIGMKPSAQTATISSITEGLQQVG